MSDTEPAELEPENSDTEPAELEPENSDTEPAEPEDGSDRTAVVGLGLIGGSLLRRLGSGAIGYDADPKTRETARAAGCEVADSIEKAVQGRSVAVVAVPFPAVTDVVRQVRAAAPEILLTDVTSVKGPVGAPGRFVGGHPMAGTEASGFAAADPNLFEGAAWVLCLEQGTDPADWVEAARLVLRTGAHVVPTTAAAHDAAVARISHLPHVLAATVALQADDPLTLALAAGSFRDATRVAGTRPELTTAMCQANSTALITAIEDQIRRLMNARRRLEVQQTEPIFDAAHAVRSAWPPKPREEAVIALNATDLRDRLLELGAAGGAVTAIRETDLHIRR